MYDQFGQPEHDVLSSKSNREDPPQATAIENPGYAQFNIGTDTGISTL